jgi:tRNA(Arg) A34 adenosine deaminase TadA
VVIDHTTFMTLALEEAELGRREGNLAVGSVIVRDGGVVERGHNTVDSARDVTAHAETVAIRTLSIRLGRPIPRPGTGPGLLAGHTLYTTVEPCAMCAYACCLAGISTIVIGARFSWLQLTSHGDYAIERLLALTARDVTIVSGVLQEQCAAVYRASLT